MNGGRRKRQYVTVSEYVDIDVDLAELVDDMTDDELADFGLMRIPEGMSSPPGINSHGLASPGLDDHLDALRRLRAS